MGGGVLVELLELEQRHAPSPGRRASRARASGPRRRPRAAGWPGPRSPPGASSPPRRAPRGASRPAWRRAAAAAAWPRPPRRPAGRGRSGCPRARPATGPARRRPRSPSTAASVTEEAVELRLRHRAVDLQPLDAALREPAAPLPPLELGQQVAPEQHLVGQEGEHQRRRGRPAGRRAGGRRASVARRVGRVTLAVEAERRERLGEGGEKADRLAHAERIRAASRMSASRVLARGLEQARHLRMRAPKCRASAETAARATGDAGVQPPAEEGAAGAGELQQPRPWPAGPASRASARTASARSSAGRRRSSVNRSMARRASRRTVVHGGAQHEGHDLGARRRPARARWRTPGARGTRAAA